MGQSLRTVLLNDPCASHWLKARVRELENRDPVDSIRDCELLVRVAREDYQAKVAAQNATGPMAAEYDYDLQAWVDNGVVMRCGHPRTMGLGCCNGGRYEGWPIAQAREHWAKETGRRPS